MVSLRAFKPAERPHWEGKKKQQQKAPERGGTEGNVFSLYPDPEGMRTDHKPRSEHLQMHQKPSGSSSFGAQCVCILPAQRVKAGIHPIGEEINTNINPSAL